LKARPHVTLQVADLLLLSNWVSSNVQKKSDMERAARLFKKQEYSRKLLSDDALIRGVWPVAVGRVIARHTCSLKKVRSTLVIEMEDATWHKQLRGLSGQIVNRLQGVMGNTEIDSVEFRVAPAAVRRELGRAQQLHPEAIRSDGTAKVDADEAEGIQDPVLQKIYRLSRKRATA
jgi:hypothetical protein